MSNTPVKEGELYQDSNPKAKYPRIIRIKKITNMGSKPYVYYVADNEAAKAIHPNGGMIPLDSFLDVWFPVKS